ncbi:hypothetical protein ACN3XK_14590 [Actinomadura welshii]
MSETDDLEPSLSETDQAAEANEADAAEQRAALDEPERPREWSARLPDEVNEADAVEQRYEVPLDEDDYR